MCHVLLLQVDEQTPLFLSVLATNGDGTANELCLAARYDPPFAAAPGSPLTLTYFLCSADDVKQVCDNFSYRPCAGASLEPNDPCPKACMAAR